jgi:hypothetical protein
LRRVSQKKAKQQTDPDVDYKVGSPAYHDVVSRHC